MTGTLAGVWSSLGGEPDALEAVTITGRAHVLPSVFEVTDVATASIGAATLAAASLLAARNGSPLEAVDVDSVDAALAFRSERHLRPLERELPPVWDPIAGDYQAADGWIRLHTNYRSHREAALRVLGAPAEREAVAHAVAERSAVDLETAVLDAGGVAAALRSAEEWAVHEHGSTVGDVPLVRLAPAIGGPPTSSTGRRPLGRATRPLDGVRVLDVTRVIAGPVATQFLAAHGAEVLRIEAPGFDEVPALHLDGRWGKRSTELDLRSTSGVETLERLLAGADVVVTGLRPGATSALGLDAASLAARHPDLVVGTLSAYSPNGPWAARRGFDSLVQMVSGIAHAGMVAADADRPLPLPCQALDHASGYLLAAGVVTALERGLTSAAVSLDRTAAWLAGLGRIGGGFGGRAAPGTNGLQRQGLRPPEVLERSGALDTPEPDDAEVADRVRVDSTPWGAVEHVRCAGVIGGRRPGYDLPPPKPGADPPEWR